MTDIDTSQEAIEALAAVFDAHAPWPQSFHPGLGRAAALAAPEHAS